MSSPRSEQAWAQRCAAAAATRATSVRQWSRDDRCWCLKRVRWRRWVADACLFTGCVFLAELVSRLRHTSLHCPSEYALLAARSAQLAVGALRQQHRAVSKPSDRSPSSLSTRLRQTSRLAAQGPSGFLSTNRASVTPSPHSRNNKMAYDAIPQQTTTDNQPPRKRLPFVDGSRGLASLWIVCQHFLPHLSDGPDWSRVSGGATAPWITLSC